MVVEPDRKSGEVKSAETSEKSETETDSDSPFNSHILDAGISPIPSASLRSGLPSGAGGPQGYGPINNPGLSKMSATGLQHSEFGRTRAEEARTGNTSSSSPGPECVAKRESIGQPERDGFTNRHSVI